jgi:hypothetical protein
MSKRRRGQVSITRSSGAGPVDEIAPVTEPQRATLKPSAPYREQSNLSTSQQNNKTISQQVDELTSEQVPKTRITIYVDEQIADRLAEARLMVKRMTGKSGYAVTRSAFVEAALAMMLEDFDTKGDYSFIVEWVNAPG